MAALCQCRTRWKTGHRLELIELPRVSHDRGQQFELEAPRDYGIGCVACGVQSAIVAFHKIKVEAFTITNDKRKDFKVRVREGFRTTSW